MAVFRYSARDSSGRVLTGTIEADNEAMVVAKLQEMGFFITRLEEERRRFDLGVAFRRFQRIGLRDLTVFSRQFATMVNAGLSIVRTLTILESQTENARLREIIGVVRRDVEEGSPLSDAMAKHPDAFSSLVVNMVRAGEVGGVLDDVLQRIASFFEKDLALRQKVRAAITYPLVVFTFAVGIVLFLVFFILPQFVAFFEGLDLVLPLPTRILMATTRFMTARWYVLLAVIVLLVYGFRSYIRTPEGRMWWDRWKLNMPLFGPLVRKVSISRFSRTFATLLASAVPIIQALDVVGRAVDNKVFEKATEQVKSSIREGESISGPLQQSGIFPPMVIHMVSVGEETGNLDGMLQKVADFYDQEVETMLSQLTSILEPLLILFLGVVVGFIVLSFYLPLYQLITGIR
ncbi:MAG: type II secretion system F family protein [Armatimonadota bacterium]|nr:type II secretion system F family protein [Armatimonadota bacterium]MDR5703248.1 type II secretion system F family protein [Armatimonadota bacterium]